MRRSCTKEREHISVNIAESFSCVSTTSRCTERTVAVPIPNELDPSVTFAVESFVSPRNSKFTSNVCTAVSFHSHFYYYFRDLLSFFQIWQKSCETFSVNYAQNFSAHVLHYKDTQRKCIVAIRRWWVVHAVKSSSKTVAISRFTCWHIRVCDPSSEFTFSSLSLALTFIKNSTNSSQFTQQMRRGRMFSSIHYKTMSSVSLQESSWLHSRTNAENWTKRRLHIRCIFGRITAWAHG